MKYLCALLLVAACGGTDPSAPEADASVPDAAVPDADPRCGRVGWPCCPPAECWDTAYAVCDEGTGTCVLRLDGGS